MCWFNPAAHSCMSSPRGRRGKTLIFKSQRHRQFNRVDLVICFSGRRSSFCFQRGPRSGQSVVVAWKFVPKGRSNLTDSRPRLWSPRGQYVVLVKAPLLWVAWGRGRTGRKCLMHVCGHDKSSQQRSSPDSEHQIPSEGGFSPSMLFPLFVSWMLSVLFVSVHIQVSFLLCISWSDSLLQLCESLIAIIMYVRLCWILCTLPTLRF